ncbi:MAG: hypothetical protein AAGD38_24460 [Acidobacteriota bacterium]
MIQDDQRRTVDTQGGQDAEMSISPGDHERDRFVAAVHAGLEDSEAGRLIDDDELDCSSG